MSATAEEVFPESDPEDLPQVFPETDDEHAAEVFSTSDSGNLIFLVWPKINYLSSSDPHQGKYIYIYIYISYMYIYIYI